jgi:hypothetical protein
MRHLGRVSGLAITAIIVLAAAGGMASATVSPAGTSFTATLTGSKTFTDGQIKYSCTTGIFKGTTANPASSVLSLTGGANITFSQSGGCPATAGGVPVGTATIETHGTWDLSFGAVVAGSSTVSMTLPNNALSITLTPVIGGDCTTTINASSLNDVTNTYTNANTSLAINDTTVSFTSTGSPCGAAAANMTITGQFSVTDAISVT